MQEAAFRYLGLQAHYLSFELDPRQFKGVMRALHRILLDGFNVTVPYKGQVLAYLRQLSRTARALGAVNTVFKRGGRWIGANTDVPGFTASLERDAKFSTRGKKVLVLGAGGSARAVVYALCQKKARVIRIANRHLSRARQVARNFSRLFPEVALEIISQSSLDLRQAVRDSELVVNATSVGLKPGDPSLLASEAIPRAKGKNRILFFDLIYRPAETPFLKAARRLGHRTQNGLGMLLYQGAQSFELWTGRKAPVPVMRKALISALKGTATNKRSKGK